VEIIRHNIKPKLPIPIHRLHTNILNLLKPTSEIETLGRRLRNQRNIHTFPLPRLDTFSQKPGPRTARLVLWMRSQRVEVQILGPEVFSNVCIYQRVKFALPVECAGDVEVGVRAFAGPRHETPRRLGRVTTLPSPYRNGRDSQIAIVWCFHYANSDVVVGEAFGDCFLAAALVFLWVVFAKLVDVVPVWEWGESRAYDGRDRGDVGGSGVPEAGKGRGSEDVLLWLTCCEMNG
jgi:hypothetical protein